ncbi:hypothetical protein [Rhizobium leguminosarum]|uniref:hypothetical protein n=1 Tax=Rhizobium TaxID=379 RepID=UPI00102FF9E0|nr:hypothetical protein [Rhizobium leguminosarum]TBG95918.1 hypothetical protein ELG68_35130 [Rhizobium leguminosarum]
MRTRQAPDLQDAKLAAMQEVQRHVQAVLLAAAVTFELAEQAVEGRVAAGVSRTVRTTEKH